MNNELRLDYHVADNAPTPFIGIYITTKDDYEEGRPPADGDVAQVTLVPGARLRSAALADAARFACEAANARRPTSAARALKNAVSALIKSQRVRSGDVARLSKALSDAASRLKQNAVMPRHPTDEIEGEIRAAAKCREHHGYTQTAAIIQTEYEPGRSSLSFRFESARPGQVLQNSDGTRSEVLATVSDTGVERLAYIDGEVLGLDDDDHVICWNAETMQAENTGETIEAYGIHNLRVGEIARVEVTHLQWVGACLISTLPPLYGREHKSGFAVSRDPDGAYRGKEWRAGELHGLHRGGFIEVLNWIRESGDEHNAWRTKNGLVPLVIPASSLAPQPPVDDRLKEGMVVRTEDVDLQRHSIDDLEVAYTVEEPAGANDGAAHPALKP